MATVHNSTQFRGVPVSKSFPDPATVIVGQDKTGISIDVLAVPALQNADAKPIGSFTSSWADTWNFGANTIAANLTALAGLSKFLQTEAPALGNAKWKANIDALVTTLNTAVEQSSKLCDDTNSTLGSTTPTDPTKPTDPTAPTQSTDPTKQ